MRIFDRLVFLTIYRVHRKFTALERQRPLPDAARLPELTRERGLSHLVARRVTTVAAVAAISVAAFFGGSEIIQRTTEGEANLAPMPTLNHCVDLKRKAGGDEAEVITKISECAPVLNRAEEAEKAEPKN